MSSHFDTNKGSLLYHLEISNKTSRWTLLCQQIDNNKLTPKRFGLNLNSVIHAAPSVEIDKHGGEKYNEDELKEKLGFKEKKAILLVERVERKKEIYFLLEADRVLKDDFAKTFEIS